MNPHICDRLLFLQAIFSAAFLRVDHCIQLCILTSRESSCQLKRSWCSPLLEIVLNRAKNVRLTLNQFYFQCADVASELLKEFIHISLQQCLSNNYCIILIVYSFLRILNLTDVLYCRTSWLWLYMCYEISFYGF